MAQNIEIKARVHDMEAMREQVAERADGPATVLHQEDRFFKAENGRLKLRQISTPKDGVTQASQLIYYVRSDAAGPISSSYSIYQTENPADLGSLLSDAFGETILVRKVRELYLIGSTRIHLDRVEGLGNFIEFEVVLSRESEQEQGQEIANQLLVDLQIQSADLLEGAYADMLMAVEKA